MQIGHEEIIEQLPAYSLGILEDEWLEIVEEHLQTCESCRAELAAFGSTVMALALSAPDVPAPAGARDRFRQMMDATPQTSGYSTARAVSGVPTATRQNAAPVRQPVAAKQGWNWRELFSPAWATALALGLLLVITGIWGLSQRDQLEQQRGQVAQQQEQIAQQQAQLDQQQGQLQQQGQQLSDAQQQIAALQDEYNLAVALLGNPEVQSVTLAATDGSDNVARLWIDPAANRAVLVSENLEPAPDGKVYELWLIAEAPVAVDVFNTEAGAPNIFFFEMPAAGGTFQVAAITVEDALVQAPTTQPILAGEL